MDPIKVKANELIEKFKLATTYKYQEYAGAHYSTFEHDVETLINCALILVNECLNTTQYEAHLPMSHPEIETNEYWLNVKNELETRIK